LNGAPVIKPRDRVVAAIQEAADQAIVPRFRALAATEVHQKGAGDVVTVADHECEQLLTASLTNIAPGVPILGEEAAANDPALQTDLAPAHELWVVDPLDGTRAFVQGDIEFAVMVAYLAEGLTQQAWIWQPVTEVMFYAQRGHGAYRNGQRLPSLPPLTADLLQQRGIIKTGFMPADVRQRVLTAAEPFTAVSPGPASAGFAYPQVATSDADFAVFWRTLPWDHAAGTRLAAEVGCHIGRPDGGPYAPLGPGEGLLVARDDRQWVALRDRLLPQA
jgi:fructose-1,6-bisphosphatase/inositol monophosphatase family enzyme